MSGIERLPVTVIAPDTRLGVVVTAIARQGFDKVRTAGRDAAPFRIRLFDGSDLLASAIEPSEVKRGLATGISGGLLSLPLVEVGAKTSGGSYCG